MYKRKSPYRKQHNPKSKQHKSNIDMFAKASIASTVAISGGLGLFDLEKPTAEASGTIKTESRNVAESTQQTQILTYKLTGLTDLKNVTVDNGTVEVLSVTGDEVKVRVSGGNISKTVQTGGTPAGSKWVDGQYSSYYSDGEGYTGNLLQYLYSGSAGDSKWVDGQMSSYYNDGTYSGSLSSYVYSGSYTSADTKNISYTRSGKVTRYYIWNNTEKVWKTWLEPEYTGDPVLQQSNSEIMAPVYYNQDGYTGYAYYSHSDGYSTSLPANGATEYFGTTESYVYAYYYGTATRPAYDTRVYRYQGTVYKPDTRQYRWQGTVSKGDTRTYQNYYAYNLNFEYDTNNAPTFSNISNQDFKANETKTIQLDATDKDGDALTYEVSVDNDSVTATVSTSGLITLKANKNTKTGTVTVKVRDTKGKETVKTFGVNVTNHKPQFTRLTNVILDLGATDYNNLNASEVITLDATDKDGDPITYSINQTGVGFSAVLNGNKITLTALQKNTKGKVEVTINDGVHTVKKEFEVWVTDDSNIKSVTKTVSDTKTGQNINYKHTGVTVDHDMPSDFVSFINNKQPTVDKGNIAVNLLDADGKKAWVTVSNATETTKVHTSGTDAGSKYVDAQTSPYYSDGEGYSGSLNSYLYSGQASQSKWVDAQTSSYYNDGIYSGSLSSYVYSGSAGDSKYVTDQISSYYSDGIYSGSLSSYLYSGSYTPSHTKEDFLIYTTPDVNGYGMYVLGIGPNPFPSTMWYSKDGYTGTLPQYSPIPVGEVKDDTGRVVAYEKIYYGNVTKPAQDTRIYRYQGYVYKPDTTVYRYQGYVYTPDTRTYRYQGTVSKPDTRQYTYTYNYNVDYTYNTNKAPQLQTFATQSVSTNSTTRVPIVVTDADNAGTELLHTYTINGSGFDAHIEGNELVITSGDDAVTGSVDVTTYDKYGASHTRSFTINVTNTAPTIESVVIDETVKRNTVTPLTINAKDLESNDNIEYRVVSKNPNVTVVGDKKNNVWSIVSGNDIGEVEIEITVTDTGGLTTTTTKTIKVENQAPTISVDKGINHLVLDSTTKHKLSGTTEDKDKDTLTVRATHEGNTYSTTNVWDKFEVELDGSKYSKGYYTSSINFYANDGLVDSTVDALTIPVIVVDNASDYNDAMLKHDKNYTTWTAQQHNDFYTTYEAVLKYEKTRDKNDLTTALTHVEMLKTSTGVSESTTLTNWINRLDYIKSEVSVEDAEQDLTAKSKFVLAQELINKLVEFNKQPFLEVKISNLVERVTDLDYYYSAHEALTILEEDVKDGVNNETTWESINGVKVLIDKVTNTTNKKSLQTRLSKVTSKFLSNKTTITPEDLTEGGVTDVDPVLEDTYDEWLGEFQPIGEGTNAQDLVNFVNVLTKSLTELTKTSVDELNSLVASYEGTKPKVKLAVDHVNELYDYRKDVLIDRNKDVTHTLTTSVDNSLVETKQQATNVYNALQKVRTYNIHTQLEDATQKQNEKQQALDAISILLEGQLKHDLNNYITNDVPVIVLEENNYEYINNGTIKVKGKIQDNNDTNHEVRVTFNGETKTITTTDKTFEVQYTVPEGVYTDRVKIEVDDELTTQRLAVTNKPVISVSDVNMFTRYVKAYEADMGKPVYELELGTVAGSGSTITLKGLEGLKYIYDEVSLLDETNIYDINDRIYYRWAEKLTGKTGTVNGKTELLVAELITNAKLDWLFKNYETTVVSDYTQWIEVVGIINPITGVTDSNIDELKSIITDYINANGSNAPTPTVDDYNLWLTLTPYVEQATKDIEVAEAIKLDAVELQKAIKHVEENPNGLGSIPNWISARGALDIRLDTVKVYYNALDSVVKAEGYLQQENITDVAQMLIDIGEADTLVMALPDSADKTMLLNRIEYLEDVVLVLNDLTTLESYIDAVTDTKTLDSSKITTDIENVKVQIQTIKDTHKAKTGVLNRVSSIESKLKALKEVEQAELTRTQVRVDKAKELVLGLDSSNLQTDLINRLNAIQAEIDLKTLEDKTKDAVGGAENSIETGNSEEAQKDKDIAQDLVDQLPDGAQKDELQEKLNEVQRVINIIKSVEQAETTLVQSDVDNARIQVTLLVDGTYDTLKGNLTDRLNEVEDKIALREAVEKAESTVSLGETTDVAYADSLLASVNEGAFKYEMSKRIEEVNDKILALKAVVEAESVVRQQQVNNAKTLLLNVDAGEFKTELVTRLDNVQKQIDTYNNAVLETIKQVEKAEKTYLQEDIDKGYTLVNNMQNDDTRKQPLLDRLAKAQEVRDNYDQLVMDATTKTEKAEQTLKPLDLNNARIDVAKLGDSSLKTNLTARLDEVQDKINAEKGVQRAEDSLVQQDLDKAQGQVNLVDSGKYRDALQKRIDEVQKIINAIKAVEKAEETGNQEDKDRAKDLVDKLPDTGLKDELKDRLEDVQKEIDTKLENEKKQKELEDAIAEAENAVGKAENSKAQDDIDLAQEMVDKLPSGAIKDNLQERLNKLKEELDKDKAINDIVKEIEDKLNDLIKDPTQDKISDLQDLIDKLPDGAKKDELQEQLDKIKDQFEKDKASKEKIDDLVKDIEEKLADLVKNPTEDKLKEIQDLIDQLPDGELKDRLQEQLDKIKDDLEKAKQDKDKAEELQDKIKEIETKLEELKRNPTKELIDQIQDLIDQLPTGKDKDRLQQELDLVKDVLESDKEVSDLLDEIEDLLNKDKLTDSDLDRLKDLIDKLPNGKEKERLQKLLDELREQAKLEKEAKEALEKAEDTKLQDDIDNAQDLIDKIKDSNVREELQKRLDDLVTNLYNTELSKAELAVSQAEKLRTNTTINRAQLLIDSLPDTAEKTKLQERLNKVKESIQLEKTAVELVVKAERERTDKSIADAYTAVNDLADGDLKTQLLKRLDSVKAEIDLDKKYLALLDKDKITKDDLIELGYTILHSSEIDYIQLELNKLKGKEGVTSKEIKSAIDKAKEYLDYMQSIVNEIVTLALDSKVSKEKMALIGVTDVTRLDLGLFVGLIQEHVKQYGQGSIDLDTLLAILERVELTEGQVQDNSKITFTDITGHWAESDIDRLVALGLINSGGLFSPNADISRAQYAVILSRTLGLERQGDNPFKDVEGAWYEDYVVALYEKGMTVGVSETEYKPESSVTRQQSMAMLGRLIDAEGIYVDNVDDLRNLFTDADMVQSYAEAHIEKLVAIDAVKGYNNTIQPEKNLTRAQMAKIVSKTIEFVQKGGKL